MIKPNYYSLLILLALMQFSCRRVTVMVESIPANTPEGSNIYITGNFNNWNPSDPNYILDRQKDSNYYVTLPIGLGTLRYKFTRGEWATEEADECGHFIPERQYRYSEEDTIVNSIACWSDKEPLDCPSLTIVLTDIPENTPKGEEIAIAGNFNNWNPRGEEYRLNQDSLGRYYVTIQRMPDLKKLEYKFTRGNLISVESDEFGNELPTRLSDFGKTDTIYASINNWTDLAENTDKFISVIIDKVPENTPPEDNLYIVGNFNGWFPRDRDYIMDKTNDGRYVINLPRKRGLLEFKITRGDWSRQEMDKFGLAIDNREYWYNEVSEIHIEVENWADLIARKEIVILIEEMTENTPQDDQIYLASNLNGWNPGDFSYRFKKNEEGKYQLKLKPENRRFEYKITRGSWDTEFADKTGNPFENRIFQYKGQDTIREYIVNWKDQPIKEKEVTFVVTSLPKKTPEDEGIYISGTFNDWALRSKKHKLEKVGENYSITLPLTQNRIEYKFNRGNWKTVEGDKFGEEVSNRMTDIREVDTIYVEIKSWKDLYGWRSIW